MNDPTPREARPFTERARSAGAVLAVAAAAAAAYTNSLDVPLAFDDQHLLERRELHAESLSPDALAPAAGGFPLHRWLPFVTFAANHAVHGLEPAGYHVVNLAIHAATALAFLGVALVLLRRLGIGDERRRRTAAAIAALLFAVHPVQTMAVTYVIQRMTSLGALFALGAVWLWLRARGTGGFRAAPAIGAVLLWWLAVSCKESYAVLPALVLLVEWCAGLDPIASVRGRRLGWSAVAAAGAIAAAGVGAAAYAAWTYWPAIAHPRADYALPVADRLLTQPRVLWHYLSLLVLPLPSRLHVDYAWPASTALLSPPATLPALLGLAALAAGAVALRRRAPLVTLAFGWFLVALAVEQSVLPIDFVFEQRLYFSALGLFVLVGWGLASLRLADRPAGVFAAVPLAAVLALGTHARNEVWRDPVRLFADPAAAGPGRSRALVNAGRELVRRGRLDDAERLLRQALALDPSEVMARAHLGRIAEDRGRLEEAATWYRNAIASGCDDPKVPFALGSALKRLGDLGEARHAYGYALAMDPRFTDARVHLALVADAAGDRAAALALLDEAVALDAKSALALMNRALFRAEAGRDEEAIGDALAALRLVPASADAHATLAAVHRRGGRAADARAEAAEALRISPGHADAAAVLRDLGAPPP
jgi:tetratricopeptide (TPR) repeat protein